MLDKLAARRYGPVSWAPDHEVWRKKGTEPLILHRVPSRLLLAVVALFRIQSRVALVDRRRSRPH